MSFDFGITPDELNDVQNTPFKMVSEDDDCYNYKCKITYKIGHIGEDKYSITKIKPSSNYFSMVKKICNYTINELIDELDHDAHFYETNRKSFNDFIKTKGIDFDRDLSGAILRHFSVNQDMKGNANSARVHFAVGHLGDLNILLFDPDHEI